MYVKKLADPTRGKVCAGVIILKKCDNFEKRA